MLEVTTHDFFLIAVLIFLEGILSVDNALVLAILAKDLPKNDQKKALTYGLGGAFIFRFIALSLVTYLVKWNWVKFIGGGYLVYLAASNLFFSKSKNETKTPEKSQTQNFWKAVFLIELTDIAFALDSILAAVALTHKLWVIYTGGIIGIILMRFAASQFILLIERFPKLERTAYMLVFVIGSKVIIEGFKIPNIDFHAPSEPAFWTFWGIMGACIGYGFIPHKKD